MNRSKKNNTLIKKNIRKNKYKNREGQKETTERKCNVIHTDSQM